MPTKSYAAQSATSALAPHAIERREPLATDVEIDILFCGVCHSDLHTARGEWASVVHPVVPGHEILGRVTRVGAKVGKFKVGDIAAVGCMVDSCRTCERCKRNLEQFCASGATFTYNSPDKHLGGMTYGGYSERIVVDEAFTLKVPANLDHARAAPLLCAGITTWSPLRKWGAAKGKKVGIVGLGVMGPNLALNLLDRGFTVAVWNLETEVMERFVAENAAKYGAHKILGAPTYEGFAALLKRPRKTLILVVAGKPTDMVIDNLMRVFEAGDVIVDTGNAHFKEQTQRAELVEARGMRFLGMGISGGAEGARKGPAFFPGGTRSVWEDIAPIVEAAAAKASDGRPCVTMCGVKGAGSCVKMFHNAGEYAVLALWGEAVAVMRSWGLSGASAREVLSKWKARGALDSYMLDITIEVVAKEALDGEPGLLLDKVCMHAC